MARKKKKKTVKLAYLDFDFNRLTQDLNKGLVFKSNIPYGYGLGSSGTLCAAVLSYYADQKLLEDTSKDPDVLKEVFIEMESFFHEKSSGLDPLVSFYNRAVFVPKKGEVELCTSRYEDALSGFYLIDSQQSRQTAQWVQTFRKHLDAEDFYAKVLEMADLQTACIAAFRQGDNDSLEAQLLLLSKAQIWAMKEWVSTTILEKWIKGIDTGKYYMKLCGAGGGGYFLAYVPHRYRAVDQLPDWIPLG